MNILAIGAHFDDLELGCGGALAKHCSNGDKVFGFIATSSGYKNKEGILVRKNEIALEEAQNASNIIGYEMIMGEIPTFYLDFGENVHMKLLELIESNQIDVLYTHWIYDVHHDHRNLALASLHVSRHINRVLMYCSNWYPSECEFNKNFYIDISETWEKKEKAIRAYQSEMKRTGEKWIDYIKNEAINNGYKVGTKYAEAFQVVKWMI